MKKLVPAFLLVIFGGAYLLFKNTTANLVENGQPYVERFEIKHPGDPAVHSLHRLLNAVKSHPSLKTDMLLSSVLKVVQTGTIRPAQVKMIDEAAQLAEQNNLTRDQVDAFFQKYAGTTPGPN